MRRRVTFSKRKLLALGAIAFSGGSSALAAYEYLWQGPGTNWNNCSHWAIFGGFPDHCYPLATADDATIPPPVEAAAWTINFPSFYTIGLLAINGDTHFVVASLIPGPGLQCQQIRISGGSSGTLVSTAIHVSIRTNGS